MPHKKPGKVVRLSLEVAELLERKLREKESVDGLLRRIFGLASIRGKPQEHKLQSYWIIHDAEGEPFAYRKLTEAKGDAVILAVQAGRKKGEAETPIRVREVV